MVLTSALIFTILFTLSTSRSSRLAGDIAGNLADNLLFTCPAGPKSTAANDNVATGLISEFYDLTNGERNAKYLNATVADLANTVYDGWTRTFNQNKDTSHGWKVEQFAGALRSGDVIYESACGEGFNLAMTLQILLETADIRGITVYGNDYIERSVEVAHRVLEKLAPDALVGSLCAWDSTDLHFVPSDTFDLAYTGEWNIGRIGSVYPESVDDGLYYHLQLPYTNLAILYANGNRLY